jgi:hypothetical protein
MQTEALRPGLTFPSLLSRYWASYNIAQTIEGPSAHHLWQMVEFENKDDHWKNQTKKKIKA